MNDTFSGTRSVKFFYGALAVIFAIFCWRLFALQVINHDKYSQLALDEHLRKFEIAPNRGVIFVRDGDKQVPVVLNEARATLFADPTGIDDPALAASKISRIIGGDTGEYEELLGLEETAYVVIKKKLTKEQVEELKAAEIEGIGFQDSSYRVYPEGRLAAQTVGFINDSGDGQYGVEAALQEELHGRTGQLKAITDVNGIPLTSSDDTVDVPAIDGKDVVLTIDRSVQSALEKAVEDGVKKSKGRTGSGIVMDPNTGAILAMANYPSFEPSKYTEVPADSYDVFRNDVVTDAYETGSGVKVFTMAAGLNEGVVEKDTSYFDAGFVQVDDRKITNAGGSGGFNRTMLEVIRNSVNTGVVYVLEQLGGGSINDQARNKLYSYFTDKFGFGNPTGVAQSGEAAGQLIAPDQQEGNNVRYANMAFGQGMTVTMLQMVSAFSSVVNGGTYYQPQLVHSLGDEEMAPVILRDNIVSDKASRDIIEMTQSVVQSGGGWTAKRDGYKMIGGKTGTAQVIQDDGTYSDSREVGSFTGYVGGEKPEFVIMTRVDEPQIPGYAGSIAAAPIFAEMSNWLIDHYNIPPGQ